jgi:hypothetical protein
MRLPGLESSRWHFSAARRIAEAGAPEVVINRIDRAIAATVGGARGSYAPGHAREIAMPSGVVQSTSASFNHLLFRFNGISLAPGSMVARRSVVSRRLYFSGVTRRPIDGAFPGAVGGLSVRTTVIRYSPGLSRFSLPVLSS